MQKDTSNSRKVELERQVQRLKNLLVSYEDAVAKHPQLRQQQNFLQREDLLKTRLSVLINELEELSRKPQKTNNTSRSITWRPWGDFPPVVALSVIVSFIAIPSPIRPGVGQATPHGYAQSRQAWQPSGK